MKKTQPFLYNCLFSCICFFLSFQGMSQPSEDDLIGWRHYMKEANEQFQKGSYLTAASYYEKVLSRSPNQIEAAYKIAVANYRMRDYKASNEWFAHVNQLDGEAYPKAYFKRGMAFKYLGRYEDAIDQFQKFQAKADNQQKGGKKSETDSSLQKLINRVDLEMKGCKLGLEWDEDTIEQNVETYHLNGKINSPFSDYAPFTINRDTLYYASLPQRQAIPVDDSVQHRYSRIYRSTWSDSGWAKGKVVEASFNKGEIHIGNPSFSDNGRFLYFTKCREQDDLSMHCNIYQVQRKGDTWGSAKKLSLAPNPDTAHSTHPHLATLHDSVNYLYFSSNRQGSKGGMDIWRAPVDSSGSVGESRNVGDSVNTPYDEITPFYAVQKDALYFSSNGHISIGGFDIFKSSNKSDTSWSIPGNIGKPENSSVDDLYYIRPEGENRAFLVSNRPGGFELKNETCCDDILQLRYMKHIYKGEVMSLKDNKSEPVNNTVAKLQRFNPETGKYEVVKQDSVDDSSFTFKMDPSSEYKVSISKNGFLSESQKVNTTGKSVNDTIRSMLYMEQIEKGKTYTLENVYYDLNKATLRPSSKETLDSLYLMLLDNPDIVIELSAHTDARGSDQYNQKLSQRRAESCVAYLHQKGISKKRLKAKGYGESKLLNNCKDGVECSEEKHQENRRTEFKVIGKIDGEVQYQDQRASLPGN